jgi:hypothetical protein
MRNTRHTLTAVLAVIAITLGAVASLTSVASATVEPEYTVAVWQLKNDNWVYSQNQDPEIWPQSLVTFTGRDAKEDARNWAAKTVSELGACHWFQWDVYVTDKLPEAGLPSTLTGYNDDPWFDNQGGWGVNYDIIRGGASCTPVTTTTTEPVTTTSESTTTTTEPVTTTTESTTTTEPVTTTTESTTTTEPVTTTTEATTTTEPYVAPSSTVPAPSTTTSTVPTETSSTSVTREPAELAYTGFNSGLFLAGLALLALGGFLTFAGRRKTA